MARPSKAAAGLIETRILDAATDLFLSHGFGAASIEAVAGKARVSKRTLYARFDDKTALFGAVVKRMVNRLRPTNDTQLFEGKDLRDILLTLADVILRASLTPRVLALQRILTAEAARFPELAKALEEQGARREAINRIGALLRHEAQAGRIRVGDPHFAAEQFLQMVITIPQRRAMGLGEPMAEKELAGWNAQVVDLFLNGCRSG